MGKYLTSPFFVFLVMNAQLKRENTENLSRERTNASESEGDRNESVFILCVGWKLWEWSRSLQVLKSSVCCRHFSQRRSKRTEDLIHCCLLSLALFFFVPLLTSSSPPSQLISHFLFVPFPPRFPFIPLSFHLFFSCPFPLSSLCCLHFVFVFSSLSLSPVLPFFLPSFLLQ